MASLVDAVIFIPTAGGTGDFVVFSAKPGWRTPAQASAVDGATYRYRAYSADQTEWEIGTGVYTAGTTTLTRAVILDSSNSGAAVNFSVAPSVALTIFSADFATPAQLAKVDFLTVTQAVDLDAMEASIASYGTAATKNTGTGAGQVPLLDGSGLLDTSILPAIAVTDVNVVASQAAMLALTAQKGDIAIRTDLNKSFALATNSPGTLADWKELLTPTDAVLSVAGLTGAISSSGLKTALAIAQADVSGLTTADSPQFTGVNVGHASDTTITRSSAGIIAVEGVTVPLNSITSIHTAQQVELGHASDTTITRDSAGVIAVEGVPLYPNIPVNSQSAAYTTVLSDAQKFMLHPAADNNARTFTIAANASVAYPIGTAITFINEINTLTIAINSDTLVLAGPGTTGSRTLAAMGMATAIKKTSTSWIISGAGLT